MRRLVTLSGGLSSYEAARRTIERHGRDGVKLLFADTKIEDDDLYRFLEGVERLLGIPITRISDGRTPWEVFRDERFIGNSRVDPCSKILKRRLIDRYRNEHFDPSDTTLVFGLTWDEPGRIERHRKRMNADGWSCEYPVAEPPLVINEYIADDLRSLGVEPPRLYAMGFPHNNCGGFCCKMGIAQATHLLETLPDRYREHEEAEQAILRDIPTTRPFLKFQDHGVSRLISMRDLRVAHEKQMTFAETEYGWGCKGGCAIDDEESTS